MVRGYPERAEKCSKRFEPKFRNRFLFSVQTVRKKKRGYPSLMDPTKFPKVDKVDKVGVKRELIQMNEKVNT